VSLRYRHEYAADLPHGLPGSFRIPPQEFPTPHKRSGCAPLPALIHQVRAGVPLRDVKRRFLAYSFPSRSPDPHHLAVLAHPGFVRAAPTLPGTTRIRLPSAPPTCYDRQVVKVSHLHSNQQRLTAQTQSGTEPNFLQSQQTRKPGVHSDGKARTPVVMIRSGVAQGRRAAAWCTVRPHLRSRKHPERLQQHRGSESRAIDQRIPGAPDRRPTPPGRSGRSAASALLRRVDHLGRLRFGE
jgi:hypothetical protein